MKPDTTPARLDADRTAKPLTRIVHPPTNGAFGAAYHALGDSGHTRR